MPPGASGTTGTRGSQHSVQREPSDDFDDYDDQYLDYPEKPSPIMQKMEELHLDDDVPDTTMLDSVILPAIASVSETFLVLVHVSNDHLFVA